MSVAHPLPQWGWTTGSYESGSIDFPKQVIHIVYHAHRPAAEGDPVYEWEYFPGTVEPVVTGMCPRCSAPNDPSYLLLQVGNRSFLFQDGRLSTLERIRCPRCKSAYRLSENHLYDVA